MRRRRLSSGQSSSFSLLSTGAILLVLVVFFAGAVYWFRTGKRAAPTRESATGTPTVLEPTSVLWAASSLDKDDPTADLVGIEGHAETGQAIRSWENGRFSIEVNTKLINTSIDRSQFAYEVWLIRPVPYDFFSLGDMVSNDIGFFVTSWNGAVGQDPRDYTQVLITKELKDGNPEPGEKIMEGTFGR